MQPGRMTPEELIALNPLAGYPDGYTAGAPLHGIVTDDGDTVDGGPRWPWRPEYHDSDPRPPIYPWLPAGWADSGGGGRPVRLPPVPRVGLPIPVPGVSPADVAKAAEIARRRRERRRRAKRRAEEIAEALLKIAQQAQVPELDEDIARRLRAAERHSEADAVLRRTKRGPFALAKPYPYELGAALKVLLEEFYTHADPKLDLKFFEDVTMAKFAACSAGWDAIMEHLRLVAGNSPATRGAFKQMEEATGHEFEESDILRTRDGRTTK